MCEANIGDNTVTCLVCRQVFSAPKQYNLARHYKNKHERSYGIFVGDDRACEVARLKAGLHELDIGMVSAAVLDDRHFIVPD